MTTATPAPDPPEPDRQPGAEPGPTAPAPEPRRLFLDDDPARAGAFLAEHPDAVWVRTVPECLGRLAETWDEVHLDHDLGGEVFVSVTRADCGMEVVRWITDEYREHLAATRFVVHSWNELAACAMALCLHSRGYTVEVTPFGGGPVEPPAALGCDGVDEAEFDYRADYLARAEEARPPGASVVARWIGRLRASLRRGAGG